MNKMFKKLELYSDKYDWEILKYGFQVLLFNAISILVIVLIAFINNNITYGICFMLSFGTIRIAMGGYHCKTLTRCLSSMSLLFLIIMVLSELSLFVYSLKLISFYLIYELYKCKHKTLTWIYVVLYIVLYRSVIFASVFSGLLLGLALYKYSKYVVCDWKPVFHARRVVIDKCICYYKNVS